MIDGAPSKAFSGVTLQPAEGIKGQVNPAEGDGGSREPRFLVGGFGGSPPTPQEQQSQSARGDTLGRVDSFLLVDIMKERESMRTAQISTNKECELYPPYPLLNSTRSTQRNIEWSDITTNNGSHDNRLAI
jgi:hypothetical protein